MRRYRLRLMDTSAIPTPPNNTGYKQSLGSVYDLDLECESKALK